MSYLGQITMVTSLISQGIVASSGIAQQKAVLTQQRRSEREQHESEEKIAEKEIQFKKEQFEMQTAAAKQRDAFFKRLFFISATGIGILTIILFVGTHMLKKRSSAQRG